jgi:hypothetical protein
MDKAALKTQAGKKEHAANDQHTGRNENNKQLILDFKPHREPLSRDVF